nr:neuronal acetylcholine receptor subunit beta-3-like [Lytechinus pictus]
MDKLFIFLICMSFYLNLVYGDSTGNVSVHRGEEGRLIRLLLDTGYDVRERPFVEDGGPLQFNLSLFLLAISDLDPKTQVLSGVSWLVVDWCDDRLSWDPNDFGGVDSFTVNIDKTWSPKLYLQNTVLDEPVNPIQHDVSQTYISYDGRVHLESPLIHHTSCDLDLERFPFDEQECWLRFTTQNTPVHLVKLDKSMTVVNYPNVSSEYNIVGTSTKSDYVTLKGNVSYEIMQMSFKLVRLPRYYVQNVTSPISFLSWLSIVIFIIPAKSGERLSAAVSLVLGLTVFQIVVTDNLPKNSRGKTAPVISYVSDCFIITIAVAIMSAIVINVSHWKGRVNNGVIRFIFFDCLRPWLLVGSGGCTRKKDTGSNTLSNTNVEDLEMKDHPENAVSTKDHDNSRLAWMKTQTSKWTRFELQPQSQESETDDDFEMIARILDRIFMLSILATLLVISLRFWMLCQESESNI